LEIEIFGNIQIFQEFGFWLWLSPNFENDFSGCQFGMCWYFLKRIRFKFQISPKIKDRQVSSCDRKRVEEIIVYHLMVLERCPLLFC